MSMANVLPRDKQIAIIGALAEGSSIRSIERITGVHRDTIMRLGVHPKASRVYAWAHETDDPDRPIRHVTVLHLGPVDSALKAVRASILQEHNVAAEES